MRIAWTILFVAACAAEPELAGVADRLDAQPSPIPVITTVADLGNVVGERRFRISGTFPPTPNACAAGVTKYPDVGCYRVTAFCNGAMEPGRIMTKQSDHIDVAIPERPSGAAPGTGSRCAFSVGVFDVGQPRSIPVWSPSRTLAPPPIEIHAVADRGNVGSQHYFELYGYFPSGGNYYAGVTCDGVGVSAGISTPNNPSTVSNQINIWVDDTSAASKSCSFRIYRLNDNVGAPPWYQRIDGPRTGANALPPYWGAYYWGGFEPEWANRLDTPRTAVRRLHDAGITGPIRFTLSPSQRSNPPIEANDWYDDYNEVDFHVESGPGERCAGLAGVPARFLPTAVCTKRFLNALGETAPGSTVILTTLDEASAGPYATYFNYLSLPWIQVQANKDAVRREYRELAAALFRTQAGTGKTFIIANWEADSMLYGGCGGPVAMVDAVRDCQDPAVGDSCVPAACRGYTDKIRALREWFKLRKAGIDDARQAAGNPSGLTILDGIEFAQYRIVHGQGVLQNCPVGTDGLGEPGCLKNADALHGIIPAVHPSVALYSAWESTGLGRVDQDLREIAHYLYTTNPANPPRFGLGEYGQPGQASVPFFEWLFRHDIGAARRAMELTSLLPASVPLEFAVIWQAFPTTDEEEALLTVEGVETNAMRNLVTGANDYGWGPISSRISEVRETPDLSSPTCSRDSMERTAPYRHFVLYGTFRGGASSKVWSKCTANTPTNTWVEATKIGTPTTGRIEIRIPERLGRPDLWCVFYVEGAAQTTPHFGPVRSPRGGPCNAIPL